MSDAPNFDRWLDRFFDSYYRRRPVNATFIGVHHFDYLLPEYSPEGVQAVVGEMKTLLYDLGRLPRERLTEAQAMDLRLARGFLQIQLWEFESHHFHRGNPSMYVGEAVFGMISLFRRDFAPFPERLDAALHRLDAILSLLLQARDNIASAPAAWIQRAVNECRGALAFLEQGLIHILRDNGADEWIVQSSITKTAIAAFRDFQRWLEEELAPRATDGYACGEGAFNLMLRQGHCLETTAEEVEAYGWEAFRGAEAELTAHADDFNASHWREAIAKLADHHPTVEHFQPHHRGLWRAVRAVAEQQDLVTWPDCPVEFVPRPAWARAAAPNLYLLPYHSAPAFDKLEFVDCLTPPIDWQMPADARLRALKAANNSVIKLNHVVHHAALGHHVQNYYAYRAESRIGQVAAVDAASRLALFCAGTMAEGWATYSVHLMDEAGFLTALESYSLHHARLRAAARSIVDASLHTGKFTLDDAVRFYHERVGMNEAASRAEAVKNSMFPGAAMMYLSGADAIVNLRGEMQARHGDRFTLRKFHDGLLSYGSVPVTLIAESMRKDGGWLE